jgi:Fe-S-cluster containining protein
MDRGQRLDVKKAIDHFLSQFESLTRLPFVTDAEMVLLYGQELVDSLEELNKFNSEKQICRDCKSRCCNLVDCELYSERFSCCTIHPYRPILCRMHFCDKYALEYPLLVKDLGDIFLDSFITAQNIDRPKVELIDSPPLEKLAPGPVKEIATRIRQYGKNQADETQTLEDISTIIEKFRT